MPTPLPRSAGAGGGGGSSALLIIGLLLFGGLVLVATSIAAFVALRKEPPPPQPAQPAATGPVLAPAVDAASPVASVSASAPVVPKPKPTAVATVPTVKPTVTVTVPTSTVPTSTLPTASLPVDGGPLGAFPRALALARLDEAASRASTLCREPGGITGTTVVEVTFEPDGRVGTLSRPPFSRTSVGSCITSQFLAIRVGKFAGARQTIPKSVTIR